MAVVAVPARVTADVPAGFLGAVGRAFVVTLLDLQERLQVVGRLLGLHRRMTGTAGPAAHPVPPSADAPPGAEVLAGFCLGS